MLYLIKKAASFILIFLGYCLLGCSQPSDSTLYKLEKAKNYAKKIAAYDFYAENAEQYIDYNDSLADLLTNTLYSKNIFDYDLEKIFKNSEIYYTKSNDDKLHVLNWFANYGGSFRIYFEIKVCKLTNQVHKVVLVDETIRTEKIFTLISANDTVYLAETSGITCNTCVDSYFTAYTITSDGVEEKEDFFDGIESFTGIETRAGDLIKFNYNEKTKQITIEYIIDDLNVGGRYGTEGEKVKITYRYNGNIFVLEK